MKQHAFVVAVMAGAMAFSAQVQAQSWNGGYLGAQIGYSDGDADYKGTAGGAPFGSGSISIDGLEGGLYGGMNVRFDGFVVGVELDANLSDVSGRGSMAGIDWCGAGNCGGENSIDEFWRFEIESSYSLRARAGALVSDSMLAYATGGLAIANTSWSNPAGVANDTFDPDLGDELDFDETHLGYVVGVGLEAIVSPNVHVKGEVLYTDYGSVEYASSGDGDDHSIDLTVFTGRIGVSYNF